MTKKYTKNSDDPLDYLKETIFEIFVSIDKVVNSLDEALETIVRIKNKRNKKGKQKGK